MTFDRILDTLHGYWAWLVLLILVLATFNALVKYFVNRPFGAQDLRISLFTLIVTHIQLLIGILLYLSHPTLGLSAWVDPELAVGDIMKSAEIRLFTVEHPLAMLLAVVLITVGYSKHKKELTSKRKFGKLALFYSLALLLVLSRIPWKHWLFE